MPRPLAVRIAFWVAVAIACLSALAILVSPLTGALYFLLFAAVAWGTRRDQPWAAVTGACVLLTPLRAVLFDGSGVRRFPIELAFAAVLILPLCAALGVGAIASFRRRRHPWGAGSLAWIAVVCLLVVFLSATRRLVMPSGSMENTILIGDSLLAERVTALLGIAPRRGDVIVFRWPSDRAQTLMKRVVGVPGDRIALRNKRLYRNGSPVVEPCVRHIMEFSDSYRDNFPSQPNMRIYPGAVEMLEKHVHNGEVVVPPDSYFVLGDNRDNSLDSRYWGFVHRSDILGRPLLIFDSHDVPLNGDPTILNVRWSRLLRAVR